RERGRLRRRIEHDPLGGFGRRRDHRDVLRVAVGISRQRDGDAAQGHQHQLDRAERHRVLDPQLQARLGAQPRRAHRGRRGRRAWTTFLAGRTAEQLYSAILAEHDQSRTAPVPGLSDAETKIWRQPETVLRMGQIMEPWSDSPRRHNTGMIVASLPPGGWHTGWVRDASYATAALARTGHFDRAKASLDFFLGADAGRYGSYVGNQPYRISVVRYFGDGQ